MTAAWYGIEGFTLVTGDLGRLVRFYCGVLGFAAVGDAQAIGASEMALLGIVGAGRRQRLAAGSQTVWLEQYERPGQPYPGGDAASPWFQHLALVVPDMAAACTSLREAAPISQGGPQALPAASGGVHAYKFRDPDGHPLELLQFPGDAIPAAWQSTGHGSIVQGIDHSAISVADAAASVAFYQAHGLTVGDRTLNQGAAQQRLDDLAGVQVAVVPMNPATTPPHLELLAYHVPQGKRGPALQPNDVAATRIVWRGSEPGLFRDPDGHLHQMQAL